jgi:hypothetical protein
MQLGERGERGLGFPGLDELPEDEHPDIASAAAASAAIVVNRTAGMAYIGPLLAGLFRKGLRPDRQRAPVKSACYLPGAFDSPTPLRRRDNAVIV